jgi:DNA-binding LytR/AlgR family response regulator
MLYKTLTHNQYIALLTQLTMKEPLRYIIVDDNRLDQLTLQARAKAYGNLKELAICDSAAEALTAINTLQPDIVFFDIDMPELNGIELLKLVKDVVPVSIFVTSHMEYALSSYELAAFDYILKPVKEDRFKAAMDRVVDFWEMKLKAIAYTVHFEEETITIKEGHNQVRIPLYEIEYLEAMKDYTKIITPGKKYMTLMPLSTFIKQLPADQFTRIHRSYAVKRDKVTRLQAHELYIGKTELPIGKTYRTEIAGWKI